MECLQRKVKLNRLKSMPGILHCDSIGILPMHVEVAHLPALLRPYPAAGDQERFTSYNLATVYTTTFRDQHYRSGLSNLKLYTSLDFILKVRANGTILFYQDNISTQSSCGWKRNGRESSAFAHIKYQALSVHSSILQEEVKCWRWDQLGQKTGMQGVTCSSAT